MSEDFNQNVSDEFAFFTEIKREIAELQDLIDNEDLDEEELSERLEEIKDLKIRLKGSTQGMDGRENIMDVYNGALDDLKEYYEELIELRKEKQKEGEKIIKDIKENQIKNLEKEIKELESKKPIPSKVRFPGIDGVNKELKDNRILDALQHLSALVDSPDSKESMNALDMLKELKEKYNIPEGSYRKVYDDKGNVIKKSDSWEEWWEQYQKDLDNQIREKKKLLAELKQATKLKEESDELDKEIENVAEELSNDPVYNKEGEFDGHTATTILSDGTEADVDDLTWDDVIYDPIKKEYINRHTGQVVKGRPPKEEDSEKVAEERNERLKDKKGVYSSILETIGSYDDSKPLGINSDGKFTTLAYMEIAEELDEEIREKYRQIEQASNSGFDDIADGLREQLFGMFNLVEELQKLQYRELDAPGTLRAVKDAYEQANYKSEVGEGAGQAVHHLEGYNWKVGDRIDPNNLILLSKEIHDEFHKLFGTGNNTIEQFIEFLKEYHPEELSKFMEKYGDKYEPKNINNKLYDERENWDENTYRKQYNRWNKLPWLKDFDENVDKALFENMAYSGFFLSDVEVPIEKEYKRGDNFFKSARLSPSDSRILDIYEGFVKNDWKRFNDMNEFQLANVLNSRLTVEALNGVIDEKDIIDIDTLKGWSRDELLEGLYESQNRGKKVLEDTISGKRELPFLGEEFGGIGEDNPFADSGLGKGLIPVIEGLKDFFAEYGEIIDIGNPFEDWDSSNLTSDKNIEILSHLFNTEDLSDGFSARTILNHVLASLPGANGEHKDKLTEIGDPSHQRKRIREFNEAYYDDSDDEKLKAWRDAKNNLAYLLGVGINGASTETINEFFSPQGKRKPLSDENVRKAFGFNPQLSTYTGNIDADLADMAEALGYIVKINEQGGLTFVRNLRDRETDPRDWINYLPNDAVVMVDSPKSETRTSVDEENEKAIRSVIGGESNYLPKSGGGLSRVCCQKILDMLSNIITALDNVKSVIDKTNETFSNEMWKRIVGGHSGGSNNSQKQEREPYKGNYRSGQNYKAGYYDFRVKELEELINTTEDDVIKDFAEKALKYANPLNKKGFDGEVKQQDLILALFGKFPDFSNTSAEEWENYATNLKVIRERWSGITTQKYKDKRLGEIDEEIKTAQTRKDYSGGSEYGKEIARLKAEKERLLAKEVVGEDVYKYIDLLKKAYEAVVQGTAPFENYYDELNNLIISIDREDTKREGLTRNRIKSMEEGIKEADRDVTEQVERALGKIERMLKIYRRDLGKDIPVGEKADIREKIDKLNELKSHLTGELDELKSHFTGEEVGEEENPYSKYGQFNPNIPHPSEESVDNETWQNQYSVNEELLNLKEEIERLKELKKTIKSETTKSLIEEQINDKKARYYQLKVLPSDVYDYIEHEKSESHADIFDTRWNFLREQFAKNKERLEYFQGLSSDLLGEDWVKGEYEETLKKLEKIKTAIHTLRGEDGYDYDKHDGAINRIGGEFEKVAISIDEAIEKAKEFEREVSEGAEKVEERNRVALGHLFGEDFEWNKDGTAKTSKTTTSTEKAPLEGRLTRMAYNFRQASQSANQFSGVLTKLFSIVGTGNALNDMITASSLRQTNQIMLASSRGMEEAKKLYDRIQMLVVKLPGNDTFLTNILTMLGTMDKALSAEDLEYMGGVIADYYMGAQAKGQFNNETERELRNYLMTGQTRNLTNSIIASEIESLKGLNSIKERTVALEKALQATGMDSIAHYDSYTNSLEEFKGRFQKAFADLGDLYLGFLQGGMKVYNFLDSLTNSTLSQFVITIAVSVMGLLAFFGVMAELLSMSAGLIEAFDVMNKLITDTDKQYSGLAQTFRKVITWIAFKTGVINADTASQVINTDATIASTISQELNTLGIMENVVAKLTSAVTNIRLSITAYISMWSRFAELDATTLETIAELGNTKVKIIARLVTYRQIIANTLNTISTLILAGALRSTTKEYMRYVKAKIESALIDTLIIALEWGATIATMAWYGATLLLSGALTIVSALLSPVGLLILGIVGAVWLLVKAFEGVGQIFGWWTNIGEMFQAIGDGIHRVWDAFMNSEPVQYIIATFQNLTYTLGTLFNWIGSIGGNIWQTIFGVDDGSKSQVFDIVGVFLEVVGFIGKIAFMTSPLKIILDIINAIGSAIAWFLDTWNQFVDSAEFQGIIKDFQEIRAVIGEAWSTLSEAFNEVREAFMSVFEDDEDMKNAVETTNILLDVLRAVATFLRVTIIPIIKFIAYVIKGIADVIKFVVDVGVGVIDFFTGGSLTQDSSNLVNQSQLAQSYSHQISNAQTIINNNFASGSVLTDARNMTAKEVMKLFTSAFGFNKSRGVNGVLN